jgi:hypothetical protein
MPALKYVSSDDIEKYQRQRKMTAPMDSVQLAAMVNFFAEGALTTLSNFLYPHICEDNGSLQYGGAKGCRCGGCNEWQVVDENNVVVAGAETFGEWVSKKEPIAAASPASSAATASSASLPEQST